jgi:cell division septal protein FtsQ
MWFRSKAKNRRLGREQVLDVRLRSSQVRATRTRRFALTLVCLVTALFGLYLLYRTSGWALDRLVYENKAFALQELDVQTDGIISTDQLRRWAGVRLEDNLMALDLARVKRDLELIPAIRSVSVERILPHKMRIRVSEREPVAEVNQLRPRPGESPQLVVYQLDADGWIMSPLGQYQRATSQIQPADPLPVIYGINLTLVQPGRRIATAQVEAALKLIVAFEDSPVAGLVDLKSIDLSYPDVLVVTTGQGSEVTFGLTDVEQQLRRWRDILDLARIKGKAIATLDLAVSNNVPARVLEASTLPAAIPKSPKPLHNRKKHV